MGETDIIGIAAAIYITVLFVGLSLFIVFIDPISRWVDKIKKRRAKPA